MIGGPPQKKTRTIRGSPFCGEKKPATWVIKKTTCHKKSHEIAILSYRKAESQLEILEKKMDVPGFILFGSFGGDNHMGCFCFYGSCVGYYMNQLDIFLHYCCVCIIGLLLL